MAKYDLTTTLWHEAALHNSELIMTHHGDLDDTFRSMPKSVCHYGSEFRQLSILEPLLRNHPKWSKFHSILSNGVIAYLSLRLPFGSSSAASEFSVVTDIAIDLIMELLHDNSWIHSGE